MSEYTFRCRFTDSPTYLLKSKIINGRLTAKFVCISAAITVSIKSAFKFDTGIPISNSACNNSGIPPTKVAITATS